jgi:threonine aldolase
MPDIDDMLQDIMNDNGSEAQEKFAQIMSAKIADALEARKLELAQSVYTNTVTDSE